MLYRVQKGDIMRASKVLGDAFQHDPLWNKICKRESDLEKRLRTAFEVSVRYCLKYGEIYAPSEDLEGGYGVCPGKVCRHERMERDTQWKHEFGDENGIEYCEENGTYLQTS